MTANSNFFVPPPPEMLELKWVKLSNEGDVKIPVIVQDEGQVCSVVAIFNFLSATKAANNLTIHEKA
jgi:hypothetical protein